MMRRTQYGFTLVEMIMVIVITGIIGGIVAVFLRAPIQQYMDVSRRADMADIADTAVRRVGRDLRLALPNSVRVTNGGAYLEYLETIGGGRYNTATTPPDCMNAGSCTGLTTTGNLVNVANTLLDGTVIPATARLVVYNQYNNSGLNCSATNPSVYCAAGSGGAPVITSVANGAPATEDQITFAAFTFFPAGGSPQNRFQIVSQPVTYVCAPAAGGVGGTLTRYWGYAIQDVQTKTDSIAELNALVSPPTATRGSALLATNVSTCNFTYDPNVVAQRSGLVTFNLGISEANPSGGTETVTLYSATHVSNVP